MLVLKRHLGQDVIVTHAATGDTLRIRVNRIEPASPGRSAQIDLSFDDSPRHFEIERPERKAKVIAGRVEDRRGEQTIEGV